MIEQLAYSWGPPLETVPTGWSNAWHDWEYIVTSFHPSPYFLMLPQIEMIVNIKYGLKGTIIPVLFSNEKRASVFRLEKVTDGRRTADRSEQYYYLDFLKMDDPISVLEDVHNSVDLVQVLKAQAVTGRLNRTPLSAHPEGPSILDRILERDLSVIPIAAEFLGYTPTVTELIEELPNSILEARNIDVDEKALFRLNLRARVQENQERGAEEASAEETEDAIHHFADLIYELQETGKHGDLVQGIKYLMEPGMNDQDSDEREDDEENHDKQEDGDDDDYLDDDNDDEGLAEQIKQFEQRLQRLGVRKLQSGMPTEQVPTDIEELTDDKKTSKDGNGL